MSTQKTRMRRSIVTTGVPGAFLIEVDFEICRRGRSAIKRVATASGSARRDASPGSAAINIRILSVAASLDIRARLSASPQGSTSSRAKADRTLSTIPFCSWPIGANRKSSNWDRSIAAEAEWVMSVTKPRRLRQVEDGSKASRARLVFAISHAAGTSSRATFRLRRSTISFQSVSSAARISNS
jgi:hypothetical protein